MSRLVQIRPDTRAPPPPPRRSPSPRKNDAGIAADARHQRGDPRCPPRLPRDPRLPDERGRLRDHHGPAPRRRLQSASLTRPRPTSSSSTPAPSARRPRTASTGAPASSCATAKTDPRPRLRHHRLHGRAPPRQGLSSTPHTSASSPARTATAASPPSSTAPATASASSTSSSTRTRPTTASTASPTTTASAARSRSSAAATSSAPSASSPTPAAASAASPPARSSAPPAQLAERGYKEVVLLGQTVNSYRWEDVGFAELLRALCQRRRHRAHPLHQPLPRRLLRRAHRRHGRRAQDLPLRPPPRPVRLRRHARGHEARLHPRRADHAGPQAPRRHARPRLSHRPHGRLLRRDRGRPPGHPLAHARGPFDQRLHVPLQRPRHHLRRPQAQRRRRHDTKGRRLQDVIDLQEQHTRASHQARVGGRERVLISGLSRRNDRMLGRTPSFHSVLLPLDAGLPRPPSMSRSPPAPGTRSSPRCRDLVCQVSAHVAGADQLQMHVHSGATSASGCGQHSGQSVGVAQKDWPGGTTMISTVPSQPGRP
jgi:hypothetical protein